MELQMAKRDGKLGLKDKRVVLTGASSGIGWELASRLAPDNDLEAVGRNLEALRSIERRFPRARAFPCDLARREAVEALGLELAGTGERPIDLLLCNAATQSQPGLSSPEFRYDTMRDELAVNFVSVCQLIRLLLPRMEAGSAIVLVNSGLAIAPKGSAPIYCASKAALRSLGQSLAIELAPRRVRVQQVYLPLVDTRMTKGRGSGKLSASAAAEAILRAVESGRSETYVGKTRWLWWLFRAAPGIARRVMARL